MIEREQQLDELAAGFVQAALDALLEESEQRADDADDDEEFQSAEASAGDPSHPGTRRES